MIAFIFTVVGILVLAYISHAIVYLVTPPHRWHPLDFFR